MTTTPDQIFAKAPGGLRLLGQEEVLAFLYGLQNPSRLLTQPLVTQEKRRQQDDARCNIEIVPCPSGKVEWNKWIEDNANENVSGCHGRPKAAMTEN